MSDFRSYGYYLIFNKRKEKVATSIFEDKFAEGFPNLVRIGDAPHMDVQDKKAEIIEEN